MPNAEAEVPPQQGDKKKKPEPFHLAEKIGEMVDYGYPLTMSFPRKDRELAVLRKFVRLAASKDLHGGQVPAALDDAPV